MLDTADVEVSELETELSDLTNLANMFEFPKAIQEATECIAECREDLGMVKDIWDFYRPRRAAVHEVARGRFGPTSTLLDGGRD